MKIAFLNITFGKVERGAETFVLEVSERLKKKNKVDVISGSRLPGNRWPFLWRFFIDPHGLSILWFTVKSLPRIFKERYDVIIPIDGGWEPAFVRLATWIYGGKMVISAQSGKGWDDRNNLWSFPNAFVSISSYLTKWAKKVNPFVKAKYIPNGVDLTKFKQSGTKKIFKLQQPLVLCVGALTNEKRIELVIKAVSRLGDVSLLVVGRGPLKGELENIGKRLLGERFYITESSFVDLPKVYRSADIFTIPSPWYRSFEIVLVEAMATNLPVVANNDPIRKEIVGDAGILVDPADTKAYADALKKALGTNWGDKPRKQAEKFDWDIIARKYEELFQEL